MNFTEEHIANYAGAPLNTLSLTLEWVLCYDRRLVDQCILE
jgi:hypothetical protein